MKLNQIFPTVHTKYKTYFKDPAEVALLLGMDPQAVQVSPDKYRQAAKALKELVRNLTGEWVKHDPEHNRYYLDAHAAWNEQLKDYVDPRLTHTA